MERSDSVAAMERLADAFAALVPGAPDLMLDRATRAPADAVGWPSGRNFRVRLRQQPANGQASAYYRVDGADLERMLASSEPPDLADKDDWPEGVWTRVDLLPGAETAIARLTVQRLRRRMRA